jgi:transcriptional regulator with XRE-family HTH domain
MNTIGQRVKALRERLGITQTQLANRMLFSRNYISIIEGGRNPSPKFVQALELLEQAPLHHSEQSSFVREEAHAGTPRERIKARRQELGLTLEHLAELTGFQKSTLRNVEEGRTRASEGLLKRLAFHLDLPLDELIGGLDDARLGEHGRTMGDEADTVTPPGLTERVIPKLSWAQAGTTEAWEDVYGREGFIGFNVRDSKAIAVEIRGDSMAPQFPHGTIAIVYPTWEAKTGDLVIARLNDGTVMFRRLHVDGDRYTFIPLNPIYPPLTVEKSRIEKILPVGGTYQNQL